MNKPFDKIVTPSFFHIHALTPQAVDSVHSCVSQDANMAGYDVLLLAIVELANGSFMIVRAGRDVLGYWKLLGERFVNVRYSSFVRAVESLTDLERSALNLAVVGTQHKCSWCELVFAEGDQRHVLMVRVSNRLSADDHLCDECLKSAYDQIQPILENGRIRKLPPRKGRNIIL